MLIKTLDACEGNRYLFNNYEKIIEGPNEKDKHSIIVRNPKTKTVHNSESEQMVLKEINSFAKKNIKSSFEFTAMVEN